MAKPELGTKRVCPSCGTKYYDLKRSPIICPNCGTVFEIVVPPPSRAADRKPAPEPKVEVAPVAEIEPEEDTVSLEEVEAEPEPDVGPDVDVEEDEPVIPDAEIEVEADDAAVPDPFLTEEEEVGDDVAGLLDVDAEPEEER